VVCHALQDHFPPQNFIPMSLSLISIIIGNNFQKSPKSSPISSKMLVNGYLVDSNLVMFSLQYYFPPAESFHEFFVIKNCRFVVCCSLYDQLSTSKFYFKVFIIDCDNNKEQLSKISKIVT